MPPSHNGYGNPNERNDTFSKFVAGGVSIAILIGVIIGIVLGIVQSFSRSNTGDLLVPEANDKADTNPRYASVKAVTTICAPTDYKEACLKSLAPVAHDDSSLSTKELLKAAFTVTMSAFYNALNSSRQMAAKTVHPMERAALSDCEDLLQYAVAEVQASFSEVGDKDMKTLPDRVKEINNWLSAVISYQETCIDGITNPEIKSAMKEGMIDASQLTSNALAIVSEISSILSTLEIPFNLTALSRSLLEQPIDGEDYPTWLSPYSRDRELLESNDKDANLKPNVVVAKDGSGEFKTINDALKAMPKNNHSGRYVIYVKAGVYLEKVIITNEMENVFMYGDGPKNTIITADENFVDGTLTYQTATFVTGVEMQDLHLPQFTIRGSLTAYEMRIGKTKPTEKEAAFKAHKKNKQVAQSNEEDSDDELITNFVRKLRKGTEKFKGKLPFKCFNCGGIGHFAAKCPLANADEDDSDSYKSKKDYSHKSYVKKGKSKSYISKRTESFSENSSNENSSESNENLFMAVLDDEKEKEKSDNEEIETEINLEEELIAALEQLSTERKKNKRFQRR
ncbi:hypothetical protein MRB53_027833 [Persea americana]|uniref:Uncharacterized protein n=1 Tax=Persea americana TaxID=3435 RepID=A0ACC2KEC0_PERAE|nr:hypothetical protein MRB53_027833 [Persea americana]